MEKRKKKLVKFVWVRVQGEAENLTRQNNPFLVVLLELLFVFFIEREVERKMESVNM